MELTLINIHGDIISNASFGQIKDAYLELFRLKGSGKFFLTIMNPIELELEIYTQSIVLIDYGRYVYDGPGGGAEILAIRYEEGTILPILEEVTNLLNGGDDEKLITLLKTLPKPKEY